MLSSSRLACGVLCVGLWVGCAGDAGSTDPRDLALGETSQSAKLAGAVLAESAVIAHATALDTSAWQSVATNIELTPLERLKQIEWNEDDAKLLLALTLRGMCQLVGGCESWLPTALVMNSNNGVSLSAAARERLTSLIAQLERSGSRARARAIQEWLANAEADLENVSSIGVPQTGVNAVIQGVLSGGAIVYPNTVLTDPSLIKLNRATSFAVAAPTVPVSALSTAVPSLNLAASPSPASGDAYILELYAKVLANSDDDDADNAIAVCIAPGTSPTGPQSVTANKAVTGSASCSTGTGDIDSALDTSCDNFAPGEEYCLNDEPLHEWGTAVGQLPHVMNIAFAASARRCEPCYDGVNAQGTLRTISNWRGQKMTMCDTTDDCDPSDDPEVPYCECL